MYSIPRLHFARAFVVTICVLATLTTVRASSARQNFDQLRRQGQGAFNRGDYLEALNLWNRALALRANDVGVLNTTGIALTKLRRYADAKTRFQRAINIKPDEPKSYFNLALVFLHEGNLARAMKGLRETLAVADWYPETHYHMGYIYEQRGLLSKATAQYVEELNVNPACAKAWLRLKRIERSGTLAAPPARAVQAPKKNETAALAIWLALICLLAIVLKRSIARKSVRHVLMLCVAALLASLGSARGDVDYARWRAMIGEDDVRATVARFANMGSRVQGYEGNRKAAEFIRREFARIGLKDIRTEKFRVPVPIDEGATLRVAEWNEATPIYCLWPNLVRVPNLPPAGIRGPLIYCGTAAENEFNGQGVEGSISLVEFNCDDRYMTARILGAKAILFLAPDSTCRGQAEKKFLNTPINVPRYWVPREFGLRLRRQLQAGKRLTAQLHATMVWKNAEGESIFGLLPGTSPHGERIVIEAYYDSMSVVPRLAPGAEQAGGITALLKLAEAFTRLRPKRSVLFLATSGHCLALSGISEFLLAHCRDERFKSRVRGSPAQSWIHDDIPFDLFLGLDLSSHSERIGAFHSGHYTTLGQRLDLSKRRYFAPYAKTLGVYAKRITGRKVIRDIRERLRADGKTLTPQMKALAEIIHAEMTRFTLRDLMRWLRRRKLPYTCEQARRCLNILIRVGRMAAPARFKRYIDRETLAALAKKKTGEKANVLRAIAAVNTPFAVADVLKWAEHANVKFAPDKVESVLAELEAEDAIGPVYEYHAESFFDNGVTPIGGVVWQSLFPGLLATDSQLVAEVGRPGLSLISTNDARRYVDTPLDTPGRMDFPRLTEQMRRLLCLFVHVLNDKDLFPDFHVELKDHGKVVRGQIVEFRVGESFLPDFPVSDVIVALRSSNKKIKGRWEKTFTGVRGTKLAMTDEHGYFRHPFLHERSILVEPYKLDRSSARILYAADRGPDGDGTYPLEVPLDWAVKQIRTVVFRCESLDVYELADPRYLRRLDNIEVLNALDYTPLKYGYSELGERGAAVFFEKGERVKVIVGSGLFGIQYLLTNVSPKPARGYVTVTADSPTRARSALPKGFRFQARNGLIFETTELTNIRQGVEKIRARVKCQSPGSIGNVRAGDIDQALDPLPAPFTRVSNTRALLTGDDNPTGSGFPANPAGALFRSAYFAARDMAVLNDYRIRQMRRFGVENRRLNVLHSRGTAALETAERAFKKKRYDTYFKDLRAARGFEAKAYPDVRATANDTVKAIIFYFALLVPFAFFCERLLLGFADIKKQIVAVLGIFVLVFIILRWVHPAFRISNSPYIIFLAFILGAMAVFVIVIVVNKFNEQIAEMRRKAARVHEADVGRLSASAAAVRLGISNMKKRKVRTSLTTVTLILLTFTVLSFTSVNTYTRFNRIPLDIKPAYTGALVRDRNWNYMEDIALRYVHSAFMEEKAQSDFIPRAWYISTDATQQLHIRLETRDGQTAYASAAVGLTAHEPKATRIDQPKYLLAGKWLAPGERDVCILPADIALRLHIGPEDVGKKYVTVLGERLLVKGLLNSQTINELVDLDGEPLSPVDLSTESQDFTQEETVATVNENATEVRTFNHIDMNTCIVVPFELVRELGGTLRSIALHVREDIPFDAFQMLMKQFLSRVGMTIFLSEGEKVVAYSSIGLSSLGGLKNLLIPILIAALIVLNTMMGSVYERFKEISIYSSVGLAPVHISALFIAESCVYAVLGAIAGYLVGQVVGTTVCRFNLLPGITLNYSSLSAVFSTLLVMGVVLLSTVYPAKVASDVSVPDVTRRWEFPEPDGDNWIFDFPFTVSTRHVLGMYVFLNDFFEGYKEESVGAFYTDEVQFSTFTREHGVGYLIEMKAWLAPFDMGISQNVELRALPTEDEGISRIQVYIRRFSGEVSSWKRLNRKFLTEIRKQFLIWRTVPPYSKAEYAEEGKRLVEQMA